MKRKAVIGILILCITLGITQFLLNATNPATAARKVKYDPIIIDGDIDFAKKAARKGWPGSGTSDDPYIIENYDLIIPYKKNRKFLPAAAISISNTTVFFEIRYSAISNFNGEVDGILLWNVINGRIYNNTISNFVNSIFLVGSDNIIIVNNNIYAYSENTPISPASQNIRFKINRVQAFISRGIFLDPSNHNVIANNNISGYTGTGVELLDSSDNLIDGNEIDNSAGENGVFLAGSDYNTITNNEIYDSGIASPTTPSSQSIRCKVDGIQAFISRGIFLDPSDHNVITNNNISGYTGTGVELLDSSDNFIDGNEIDNSAGENGVFLAGSDYNTITNNEIYDSGTTSPTTPSSQSIRCKVDGIQAFISRGIFLDPSDHNVITNNNISGYTGTGVELLDSSDNLIDGNMIDNSAGENGVFLAGSDYNTIMDNDIFDSGAASSSSLSSQSIRSKVDGTQAFISRGIFLDPSNHNTIANNRISGYTGTGVELLDSSDNLIDGNMIDNSAGENGVFLAGSDYNSITNNDVWGLHTDNNPMSPSSQNIKYKISGVNAFISRGIFLDPSNYNIIINNTVSNITGTGVELLGSSDNLVDGNEISNNAEYGIFLQGSISTNVSHNVIYNDEFYGVSISNVSADNSISWNDFIGNNVGGTSQINDDGSGNQFSNNFLVDHDNTDYNNDSTSDNPYYIDGDAGSTDYTPNSLPVQPLKELGLALADLDAEVDYESETLNLKNEGNYETVKIKLPEGYSVTNINVSSIYTDGFIYAEEAQVQNPRTLIVKFSRPTLVSYLEWKLENETFPINVKLNVTGWLNGAFLKFYGYDIVKILNSDGTAAAIDQKLANPVEKPTQKFIDQIVETMIDASEQILIGQINGAQKPSGLTLSLLFAPMIAAVVVRRFYFVKKA